MTLLARLVETSKLVASTSARSAKVRAIATCLRSLNAVEVEIGVLFLSGEIRQGRIGIGYSTLRASVQIAASEPRLQILEVDRVLADLAATRGTGSTARRSQTLSALFSQATVDEQEFVLRLLVGELRQGALAGVMIDAIALAAELPLPDVRRAAMYESNLGILARVGFESGAAGLQRFELQVM